MFCFLAACQPTPPPAELGGALSADSGIIQLSRDLTPRQRLDHSLGASFFGKPWVSAPSATHDRDGLGPLFNAHSCSGCHIKHGRGRLPGHTTDEQSGLIFRLHRSPFGEQLQTRALPGFDAEDSVTIKYRLFSVTFSDGFEVTLRKPEYKTTGALSLSPRLAPALTGVGLINAIPDATLLQQADPEDRNRDGISGRAQLINDRVGRFGWKAEVADLKTQVAKAFVEDIGITSPLFAREPSCHKQNCDRATGGDPEITGQGLRAVVDYLSVLTVPKARLNKDVRQGWRLFTQAGCGGCHRPQARTGAHAQALLAHQNIYPFSDFLLHDMGAGLADSTSADNAREWRTAPLWALGEGPYLHDGRARTLLEAILWHDGEAQDSIKKVLAFDSQQRHALLEFLGAL